MEAGGRVAVVSEESDFKHHSLPYSSIQFHNLESLLSGLSDDIKLVLLDMRKAPAPDLERVASIKHSAEYELLPIVVIHDESLKDERLLAFKSGCDDFISDSVTPAELKLRCEKLIFNRIANEQLQARIAQANEMAFIAMSGTSDLGVNIQFMIDANQCNNLDELGLRLLQAVSNYGIKASLQLCSEFSVKNMEMNGMAKELESALMWELKDGGRYIDYGKRSVMNYEQVSLLVKNMPLNDEHKYGAIKDNVFSLLQGADARIKALDNEQKIHQQQDLMRALAMRLERVMKDLDSGYQLVMRDIAEIVENMAESTEHLIARLALHEEQELALEKVMDDGIIATNDVFAKGIVLDASLRQIVSELDDLLLDETSLLSDDKKARLMRLLNSG